MKSLLFAVFLLVLSCSLHAASHTLKRVIITWDDGSTDDSATSKTFKASGTMQINGNTLTQTITFCEGKICDKVVDNASGTITYVHPNYAYITARRNDDGSVDNLILQSVSPNIITLYVYEDGTAEAHEWQPTGKNNKQQPADDDPRGSIGRGVAAGIKSTRQ